MVSPLPAQTRSGKMFDGAASWCQISVHVRPGFPSLHGHGIRQIGTPPLAGRHRQGPEKPLGR